KASSTQVDDRRGPLLPAPLGANSIRQPIWPPNGNAPCHFRAIASYLKLNEIPVAAGAQRVPAVRFGLPTRTRPQGPLKMGGRWPRLRLFLGVRILDAIALTRGVHFH